MLRKLDEYRYLVPTEYRNGMKVEGLIYASAELMRAIEHDKTVMQVADVATLPGLVGRSLAMPDAHQGYGFPIGGVAASDAEHGVVSAGGVGFDINCGVRLLATTLQRDELTDASLDALLDRLFSDIPCGPGRHGRLRLKGDQIDSVLRYGARWAVQEGYGLPEDPVRIESNGMIPNADPSAASPRAHERGREQLGTLGSGNHFVEIQVVDAIEDPATAAAFGLRQNQVVVLVHTGSRGLGHQVCSDYLEVMQEAMRIYMIHVVDRQLACVPVNSKEGQKYLSAMAAAANFAFANRQLITHWIREAFAGLHASVRIVYDVAHNIAKFEEHTVGGKRVRVLVHRKGATRAFPAHHPDIPPEYAAVGQPVLIPGSMGTASYVLVGTEKAMEETFGSTCHGAGRAKSRTAAKKGADAGELVAELKRRGVHVRGASKSGLTEESPDAYKDVGAVVDVVHGAGIARKVARMVPIGVIKG